jgi:peptidoglycan/LPS O-acetylase OafA/YrhL
MSQSTTKVKVASLAVMDKAGEPRLRLDYLDGLRALAALYVVLFHCWLELTFHGSTDKLPDHVYRLTTWMAHGRYSVAVFIVLSGYCLMLPVARSADARLRGGVWEYLKRRARRILPPYYAALVLTLMLISIVPGMASLDLAHPRNWNGSLPAFAPNVLLSHMFMVHNLSPDWAGKINGPMWSVATEWHIYFLFPLLLLPVWRWWGIEALLIAGFTVGIGLHLLFPEQLNAAVPWYIGLFALGMAGAVISFPKEPGTRAVRDRVPWGALAFLLFMSFALIGIYRPEWPMKRYIAMDTLVGAAAVSLILYCTRSLTRLPAGPRPLILRLLNARPTVTLGRFSYSLYLIHAPVLSALSLIIGRAGWPPAVKFATLLVVGVPLSLGLAYLFHRAFERRFMSEFQRKSEKPADRATAPDAAQS